MKYDVQLCEVLCRAQTAENTFDYTVLAPKLAEVAQPGQFAHIYVPGKTLRRPISICDIDKKNGTLRFVFQIRGAGTEQLSKFEVGDKMDILAPLGHGFTFDPNAHNLFIGGGIGVPPLFGAARQCGKNATVAVGFRNKDFVILEGNIPCEISLEERMACGIGACLGCAVELYDENGETYMGHVCKDGPVFPAERVVF